MNERKMSAALWAHLALSPPLPPARVDVVALSPRSSSRGRSRFFTTFFLFSASVFYSFLEKVRPAARLNRCLKFQLCFSASAARAACTSHWWRCKISILHVFHYYIKPIYCFSSRSATAGYMLYGLLSNCAQTLHYITIFFLL